MIWRFRLGCCGPVSHHLASIFVTTMAAWGSSQKATSAMLNGMGLLSVVLPAMQLLGKMLKKNFLKRVKSTCECNAGLYFCPRKCSRLFTLRDGRSLIAIHARCLKQEIFHCNATFEAGPYDPFCGTVIYYRF